MQYPIKFMLVLILMTIFDIAWAQMLYRITERKSLQAGLWSAGVYIISAFITISYVTDPLLLFPGAIGAFLGTFLTVKYESRK